VAHLIGTAFTGKFESRRSDGPHEAP
jgi:hypothetical protein